MKKFRRNVFETNSSSTHSLSVIQVDDVNLEIPKNMENFDVCSSRAIPFDTIAINQQDKLRLILSLIAARIHECEYNLEIAEFFDGYDVSLIYNLSGEDKEKIFKRILEFPWLLWLQEVIKEESNTTLLLEMQVKEFPYFSGFIAFEEKVINVLDISKEQARDKDYMKALFKNWIYNSKIVLLDEDLDY